MGSKGHPAEDGPQGSADATAAMLRQIGDVAGISVWTWDAESNRILHGATIAGRKIAEDGAALSEMLQRLHPGDRARVRRRLRAAARSRKSGMFQFRSAPRGSEVREYNATHFPLGPSHVQVIVQDVTRTRRAEDALRESEDHYRTAVALNPEVPWLADPEGNIIEFGPRWLDMVDLNVEETLGQGWARVLHPDDLPSTLGRWGAGARRCDREIRGCRVPGRAQGWALSLDAGTGIATPRRTRADHPLVRHAGGYP